LCSFQLSFFEKVLRIWEPGLRWLEKTGVASYFFLYFLFGGAE